MEIKPGKLVDQKTTIAISTFKWQTKSLRAEGTDSQVLAGGYPGLLQK